MRTKSIESGIPFSHLEAAAGMIPADLLPEIYERMAGEILGRRYRRE